jgi:hypothetical protein
MVEVIHLFLRVQMETSARPGLLPVVFHNELLNTHFAKAVPLQATTALGGGGGIAPTHFRPWHYIAFNVQLRPPT